MDIGELIFDATIRAIASSLVFIILYRMLKRLQFKLEVIEALSQGAFLHSSNIDREIYYLRRRVCLEHYYPPHKLEVESK